MEKPEMEKSNTTPEDVSQLNRNRSFKAKQLVRSQAIRESASPPRTVSPRPNVPSPDVLTTSDVTVLDDAELPDIAADVGTAIDVAPAIDVTPLDVAIEDSSHADIDVINDNNSDSYEYKKQSVEIQITPGAWDAEPVSEQKQRAKRWLGQDSNCDTRRDLLSNSPRIACVCGYCGACPHCRGRRRRAVFPKQDSGIVCPADGVDSDGEDEQFYCRCLDRKDKPKNVSLSRGDSDDRFEPTGIELVAFIKATLNKNSRDRLTLLRIERELHSLVTDNGRCILRFPVMTSYGRMLVHRCAALFQLSHHIDPAGKTCVLVSKSGTSGGRIPCTSFKEWCTVTFPPSPQRHPDTLAKSILKRDTQSLDESGNGPLAARRSKSLEQRVKEYERVRRRIFREEKCSQEEQWLGRGAVRLLRAGPRLLKVQSLELPSQARDPLAKSHSFGGYGGDEPSPPSRVLSRHGDLAASSWRVSPSSSGYKTLSLRSTDSVTPSPTGGASPEPGVVWCVSDLSSVPVGALVIHPQTGRPITNPDGSTYYFDPANPPPMHVRHSADKGSRDDHVGRQESSHTQCQDCECAHKQTNIPPEQTNNDDSTKQYPPEPTQPYQPEPTPVYQPEPNRSYQQEPTRNYHPEPQKFQSESLKVYHNEKGYQHESPKQYQPDTQNNYQPGPQKVYHSEPKKVYQNEPPKVYQSEPHKQHEPTKHYQTESPRTYQPETMPPKPEAQYYQQLEVTAYAQPEMTQTKMASVPVLERPVSLNSQQMGIVYPTIPQALPGYQFACRPDQPVYEHKAAPAHSDHTFRIDPSYPYGTVDYAACGACVDPNQMQHPHRSYSMPYNAVELPVMQPYHPMGGVMLPQHLPHAYQQYHDGMQWAVPAGGAAAGGVGPKIVVPDVCPVVPYPPPYQLVYPQVIPQPYPFCQQMYPLLESSAPSRPAKQGAAPASHRATPATPPGDKRPNCDDRNDDISARIQQIKEQMALMNTRGEKGRNDWRRRNSGNGLLGSYPSNAFNGRGPPRATNDESQLSSAARAIVNSIRNIQSKNTPYQPERRQEARPERRHDREDDRNNRGPRTHPPHTQIAPANWVRRSPAPVHPVLNHPRRPHPETRNGRR